MWFESRISNLLRGEGSQEVFGSYHHQDAKGQFAVELPKETVLHVQ